MKQLRSEKVRTWPLLAVAIAWVFVNIIPLWIMLVSGFKSMQEIFLSPYALPTKWLFENYSEAWRSANFSVYFVNSVFVTTVSIVATIFISSMGAYVIARFRFPGRRGLYLLILSGLVLPVRLTFIPLFLLIRSIGLYNSYTALILLYTAGGISFTTFLLINFFRTLPFDIEESARIDGASHFQVYRVILLPILRPALATAAVFNFTRVWNDFFFPLLFTSTEDKRTIPLGIQVFFGEYSVDWSLLFAALNIAIVPVIIFFLFMSRQFIGGLTQGAIK